MSEPPHARRHELRTVSFQNDLRQGSWRRSLQNRAVLDGKKSLVARAFETIVFRRIVDRTRQVRAFLAVRDVFVLTCTHHNAVILRSRVGKQLHAADWNLTGFSDFDT